MRRTLVALSLTLAFAGWINTPAFAQAAKSTRGTVTAMAADTVTVKVANVDMTFAVDAKTTVQAPGGSTKTAEAQKAGAAGPKLSDVIKVGQAVEVSYHELAGGKMHAASIRAVASAGANPAAPGPKTSSGTVGTVSATSMTISGSSGGGATFTQTYTIDADTKVVGVGVGTAAAKTGGKTVITDLVKSGDKVSVSYSEKGATLIASEVRVTMKGTVK